MIIDRPRTLTGPAHQIVTENIGLQLGATVHSDPFHRPTLESNSRHAEFGWLPVPKEGPEIITEDVAPPPHQPRGAATGPDCLELFGRGVAGANKLTRVAHLRGDPLLQEILQVNCMNKAFTSPTFEVMAHNLRAILCLAQERNLAPVINFYIPAIRLGG